MYKSKALSDTKVKILMLGESGKESLFFSF